MEVRVKKSVDLVVFMNLALVGYLENLNSDRRIISTSRMRMDILGALVNFTAMKQVNTRWISLATKGIIMAAVAYNLKKLVNGISTRSRRRPYRKTVNSYNKHVNRCLGAIREVKKPVRRST